MCEPAPSGPVMPGYPGTQIGASGAPRASRLPRLRPPRRQDGHTASMLKTIPPRVIPKTIPLRVMPQRRPPRVISQPTPLRVVGVGENCGQGVRRAEDLHVARCLTGGRSPPCRSRAAPSAPPKHSVRWRSPWQRPRLQTEICCSSSPFARSRSLRRARHESRPAPSELPSATYRQLRDISGFTHRN
jgi:hypothetical protein